MLSLCALRGVAGPDALIVTDIVTDTFTRANASVLGTADTGQSWTAHTGTWGIDTNQAKLVTQSGDSVATVSAGISDFNLYCDVTIQGAPGVVFRTTDANNFLLVMYNGGQMQVWQRVAGAYTQKSAVNNTLSNGSLHTFRVQGVGSTVTVYVDGTQTNQVTSFTQFQTGIRYGLRQNDGFAARYDNFRVTA